MADRVEAWCGRVKANDRSSLSLVISGVFGCGKTQALRAARRYVRAIYMDVWPGKWPKPINLAFIEFPKFVHEIVVNDNQEHYEDVCSADVVFIDDIGAEEDRFRAGAPTRVLGDLLGALEKRFTFITTNIAPDGWEKRWDGRVEDRLLRRNSVVCDLWRPEYATESFAKWQLLHPEASA